MVPVKLNFATIDTNLNHNTELIRAVVAIIVEDLPVLVEDLQAARRVKSEALIRRVAHKIGGLISNFEAEPLSTLTNELQMKQPVLSDTELDLLISAVAEASRVTVDELTTAYALGSISISVNGLAKDESREEPT